MTISVGQVGTNSGASVANGSSLLTAAKTTSASGSGFVVVACAIAAAGDSVTYTVSDTFGNTYTHLSQLSYAAGGDTYLVDRWYIAPGATGYAGGGTGHQATISPTTSGSNTFTNLWVALIEMPGAATGNSNFYGAAASDTYPFSNTGPYASTSLAVSPPTGGAVLLSVLDCDASANSGTESTGFTVQLTAVLNGNSGSAIGTKAVTSSATYTPSWSWTSANEAFSTLDSFFGPAGTGAALAATPSVTTTATGALGPRHVVANLVQESATSPGTSAFALAGALTGFQAFSAVMNDQDTCLYLAQGVVSGSPSGPWEIGIGRYNVSGDTLTRLQVLKSSAANALVNFTATVNISLTEPAEALWNKGCFNIGPSGSAITVDWSKGPYQMLVLTANCTITFANSMMCPHGVLELYQDQVGGRIPTITGAVYRNGSPPSWSPAQAAHDTLEVHYNAVTGQSNIVAPVSPYGAGPIVLSTYPGVDPTGTNDSLPAVTAAFALAASTGRPITVDCPIVLNIGTNIAAPIPVASGTNVIFTAQGLFIVNNLCIPVFYLINSSDGQWLDAAFKYVGTLPAADNPSTSGNPLYNVPQNFNNVTLTNYLAANFGNTFSNGGTALWSGPTNSCAIFMIRGQSQRLRFRNLRLFVPQGTNAASFIPVCVTMDPQWLPSTAVTSSTTLSTSTAAIPTDIEFDRPTLDGVLMGIVGDAHFVRIISPTFKRYSDLQDSSGGNVGGVSQWFAPPHAVYLGGNLDVFPQTVQIEDWKDEGIYVGTATRRPVSSGFMHSLKMALANGSSIRDFSSLRPDGGLDLLSSTLVNGGGVASGMYIEYDSTVTVAAGGALPGFRMPSSDPYVGMTIDNVTVVDTAATTGTPAGWPISGSSNTGNQDVSITNLTVRVPDLPSTYYPGFTLTGTRVKVQARYFFDACSTTQTAIGSIAQQGTAELNTFSANFDIEVYGWRSITSNFDGLKQRMLFMGAGTSGNRGRILDVTNGYEAIVENGVYTEIWAPVVTVTPTSGSSTFSTGITFPYSAGVDAWSLDGWGDRNTAALGTSLGLTTYSLVAGSAGNLLTGISPSVNANPVSAAQAPFSLGTSSQTLELVTAAGTFDGTGVVMVAAKGRRFSFSG